MWGTKNIGAGACWSQTSSFPSPAIKHHQVTVINLCKPRPAAAAAVWQQQQQQQRQICRSADVAAEEATHTIICTSTAIELRRNVLMQQLLDEASSTLRSSGPTEHDEPVLQHGGSSSSKRKGNRSQRSKGFSKSAATASAAASSSSSSSSSRTNGPAADVACLCGSRLKYKDCCRPFINGAATPKSAVELVASRITAAKTGNAAYLAATTHADSNLALGGARDMAGRARRICAYYRSNKFEVVGMAHCPGDASGTWVVLAILQATSGEFAGQKAPYMELVARKNWKDPTAAAAAAAAAGAGRAVGDGDQADFDSQPWMYLRNTNQFPQNGQSEVLLRLIQRHCPELFDNNDADDDNDDQQQQQQRGLVERDRSFVWTTCNLQLKPRQSSSSSSGSSSSSDDQFSWYVDLLNPHVELLGSAGQQVAAAAAFQTNGVRMVDQHRILTPRDVFIMDDYIKQQAQRKQKHA